MTPRPHATSRFPLILVAVALLLAVFRPVIIGNDGEVRFRALSTLLREGHLDSTKYSLAGPFLATPFWLVGTAVGYPEQVTWLFNEVVFLGGVLALWAILRRLLQPGEADRFALLLLFASMFPWHGMTFGSELFTAFGLGLGLTMLATRVYPWLGGALAVWGTVNTPASAVGLTLAVAVLCWHRKQLRYLLLPAAAAALILLENWARRGDPLSNGYEGEAGYRTVLPFSGLPGFSYPLFFGLLSVLFSFGKGLVFFAPGLFARYPEAEPATDAEREATVRLVYRLWMAVAVGLVLVYTRWWAWYGGAVWGPRFFPFVCLPASLVLARWLGRTQSLSLPANLLLFCAVGLSFWAGANGYVFGEYDHEMFWANDFALEYLTWYTPEFSVLWRPFVVPKPLLVADYARLAGFGVAFAYLAWPVLRVLAGQLRAQLGAGWQALRRTSWRF